MMLMPTRPFRESPIHFCYPAMNVGVLKVDGVYVRRTGREQLQQIDFSFFPFSLYREILFLNFNTYGKSAPAD